MNFSSGDDIFIKDSIRQAGIDYLISYGAPLLHRNVFEAPKKQTWNIHPSLLPSYRGGLPLFWQAWDGVQSTGVTVHLVNEGIDRGAILAQQAFPIAVDSSKYVRSMLARSNAASVLSQLLVIASREGGVSSVEQPAQSDTVFAKQVTLNRWIKECPLDCWLAGQLMRVCSYIQKWPELFPSPIGYRGWLPYQVSGYQECETDGMHGFHTIKGELRFYVADGFVSFSRRKGILAFVKFSINRLKIKLGQQCPTIYL
nr:formyltransferase family protein [Reinekea sp. G2M2-21]